MVIDILTLFPKMFEGPLSESILKRAQALGAVRLRVHDLRRYSKGKHRKADDRPYGGGPGMVLLIQPIYEALKALKKKGPKPWTILLSAAGERFNQTAARRFARRKRLILICGHYEGVDARVSRWVDQELSIGDYVLTGGELPAMVVADGVVRLLPGVLGHKDSAQEESFEEGLLEYPHYTRPRAFQGMKVPEILFSGDHGKISAYRRETALQRTRKERPDLLKGKQR